jgi:hypothetical protein
MVARVGLSLRLYLSQEIEHATNGRRAIRVSISNLTIFGKNAGSAKAANCVGSRHQSEIHAVPYPYFCYIGIVPDLRRSKQQWF